MHKDVQHSMVIIMKKVFKLTGATNYTVPLGKGKFVKFVAGVGITENEELFIALEKFFKETGEEYTVEDYDPAKHDTGKGYVAGNHAVIGTMTVGALNSKTAVNADMSDTDLAKAIFDGSAADILLEQQEKAKELNIAINEDLAKTASLKSLKKK